MTLADFQDQVLFNLYAQALDTRLSQTRVDRAVNAACQHVSNLVAAQRPGLFYRLWTGTIDNAIDLEFVVPDLSGNVLDRVRKVVMARRRGSYSGDDPTLPTISPDEIEHKRTDALQDRPAVFVYNSGFAFLRPANGIAVEVLYEAAMPAMLAVSDSPGEVGGAGTADFLPLSYQHLIPSYAAVLCLAAAGRDVTKWLGIFQHEAQAAGLDVARRAESPVSVE